MLWQPHFAPLGQQIEEIPYGRKQIDAPVLPWTERRLGGIRMVNPAIATADEDADPRFLPALSILDEKIPVEVVVVTGQDANFVPSAAASPLAQFSNLGFGHQDEVHLILPVRPAGIVSLRPLLTHRAK